MKAPTRAPFYAAMYHALCTTAREHGYALAIHGTVTSDLDLVAIPWTEEAAPASAWRTRGTAGEDAGNETGGDEAMSTLKPGRASYIQQRMNNAPTSRILAMWYEVWKRVIRGKL